MKLSDKAGRTSSVWELLSDPNTGLVAGTVDLRLLLLASHPDDETIGAFVAMSRLRDATVVFLTDGAPRDTGLWSGGTNSSREEYAAIRREEARSVLSLVGIPPERILCLGAIDQEAANEMPVLIERYISLFRQHQSDIVLTHPYEGGHPDHDSAALIARLAVNSIRHTEGVGPELLEMTSYHLSEGRCVTGEFLEAGPSCPELILQLSAEEQARKEKMMALYRSQRLVLQDFPVRAERLRVAPDYDFTRAPHPGKLWYECLDWPMTGARWRQLASDTLSHFDCEICD